MRAYTYIDRAKAHVGNRWVDRGWSAFLGATSSLVDRTARFDWLAERSSEFEIQVNGLWYGILDFGDVEWSEENSPYGATLVARKRRPSLEITVRTLVLHSYPGQMRRLSVTNSSEEPVIVGPIWCDMLPLLENESLLDERRFPAMPEGTDWKPGSWALTAKRKGRTLTCLGSAGSTLNGDISKLTIETSETFEVLPGRTVSLPPTFLYLHEGAFSITTQSACADFLLACAEAEQPLLDDDDDYINA